MKLYIEDKESREAVTFWLVMLLTLLVGIFIPAFYFNIIDPEIKVCGIVDDAFTYDQPRKRSIEEVPTVVFYNDSLKRNIAVERVSWNSYVNIRKGEEVCFYIRKSHLK